MRYLPHTSSDRKEMLKRIGVSNIDALFPQLPKININPELPEISDHWDELSVQEHILGRLRDDVPCRASLLGAGLYHHHIPATVDALIQRGEFMTSYTPYQPEISQGTLQYLFEFQTQVCLLTGMEIANASLYDGATAMVEAMFMAQRITGRSEILLSGGIHPQYADVASTYADVGGWSLKRMSGKFPGQTESFPINTDTAAVVVQYPDFFGTIEDFSKLASACHDHGALFIVVVTEIISLGILEPPPEADIIVAEGQSLGNAISFGGPTLGLLACRADYMRQLPGRVVGETIDTLGRRGWVLTLSAREQHIRREKATSNICTNAGLCALAFTIHLTLLGELGLKRLAALNHQKATLGYEKLSAIPGMRILNTSFFNEFVVELPIPAKQLVDRLAEKGLFIGVPLSDFYGEPADRWVLMAFTEMLSASSFSMIIDALEELS